MYKSLGFSLSRAIKRIFTVGDGPLELFKEVIYPSQDKISAFNGQSINPKPCYPMGEEWKAYLSNVWWSTYFKGSTTALSNWQKQALAFKPCLLSAGGEDVCFAESSSDMDFATLKKNGRFFDGKVVTLDDYASSLDNFLNANPPASVTYSHGYRLADDGMWRYGDWMTCRYKDGSVAIASTYSECNLYFGVPCAF